MLLIPPKYHLTKDIVGLLTEIEANMTFINTINIPLELEQNIRKSSIMRSALFSSRIEGNTLTTAEVQSFSDLSSDDQRNVEVSNLYKVIEKLLSDFPGKKKKITTAEILRWQKYTMEGILFDEYSGRFRKGHEGVFDSMGNVVYLAPAPQYVSELMKKLLLFSNSRREKIIPIKAVLAHLIFEKIHPFVDGNGRVGRLLQMAILSMNGYGMKGLTVVEEEIDKNRQSYYRAIQGSTGANSQPFVELMLEFIRNASLKAKDQLVLRAKNYSVLDLLHPRQKEIVLIISEQKMISFESLKRRFLKVSDRQIAYDLNILIKKGYIIKMGSTRGAMYGPKE